MTFQVIISNQQIELIKKAFKNVDVALFSEDEQNEMKELADTFDYIIEEGDTESLHDLVGY